jgi:hypothetical protein
MGGVAIRHDAENHARFVGIQNIGAYVNYAEKNEKLWMG